MNFRPFYVGDDPAAGFAQQQPQGGYGLVRAPDLGTLVGPMAGKMVAMPAPAQMPYPQFPQAPQGWPGYDPRMAAFMGNPAFFAAPGWPQGLNPNVEIEHGTVRAFNPRAYNAEIPRTQALQTVGFTPATAIAAGASATMVATIEKPGQFSKLTTAGDVGSFVILSFTAAGNTISAGGGEIPAQEYAKLDELENIGIPWLNTSSRVTMVVQNVSAVPASLRASLRGLVLQG